MAAGEPTICEICKRGHVTKRMEDMAFRQWSDKRIHPVPGHHLGRHLRQLPGQIPRSGIRQDLGRGFPTRIREATV